MTARGACRTRATSTSALCVLLVVLLAACGGGDASSSSDAEWACISSAQDKAAGDDAANNASIDLTKTSDGTWTGTGTVTIIDPVDGSAKQRAFGCTATVDGDDISTAISGLSP